MVWYLLAKILDKRRTAKKTDGKPVNKQFPWPHTTRAVQPLSASPSTLFLLPGAFVRSSNVYLWERQRYGGKELTDKVDDCINNTKASGAKSWCDPSGVKQGLQEDYRARLRSRPERLTMKKPLDQTPGGSEIKIKTFLNFI